MDMSDMDGVEKTASATIRADSGDGDGDDPSGSPEGATKDPVTGETRVPDNEKNNGGEEKLLAGKYKTQEELEKGYLELQQKFSNKGTSSDSDDDGSITGGDTDDEDTDAVSGAPDDGTIGKAEEVEDAAEEVNVNLNSVIDEVSKNGSVSDDTYKRLAEKGLSRQDVDTYVAGQRALADRMVNNLADAVGGRETFDEIRAWAKTNLDETEAKAYDSAIAEGNEPLAKMLLRGIKASYVESNGSDPNLVRGDNVPSTTGVKPFKSNREMVEAMRDPRYDTDAGYRKDVEARIKAARGL